LTVDKGTVMMLLKSVAYQGRVGEEQTNQDHQIYDAWHEALAPEWEYQPQGGPGVCEPQFRDWDRLQEMMKELLQPKKDGTRRTRIDEGQHKELVDIGMRLYKARPKNPMELINGFMEYLDAWVGEGDDEFNPNIATEMCTMCEELYRAMPLSAGLSYDVEFEAASRADLAERTRAAEERQERDAAPLPSAEATAGDFTYEPTPHIETHVVLTNSGPAPAQTAIDVLAEAQRIGEQQRLVGSDVLGLDTLTNMVRQTGRGGARVPLVPVRVRSPAEAPTRDQVTRVAGPPQITLPTSVAEEGEDVWVRRDRDNESSDSEWETGTDPESEPVFPTPVDPNGYETIEEAQVANLVSHGMSSEEALAVVQRVGEEESEPSPPPEADAATVQSARDFFEASRAEQARQRRAAAAAVAAHFHSSTDRQATPASAQPGPAHLDALAARREAYRRAMSGQVHAEQGSNAVADPDAEWRARVQTVPERSPRTLSTIIVAEVQRRYEANNPDVDARVVRDLDLVMQQLEGVYRVTRAEAEEAYNRNDEDVASTIIELADTMPMLQAGGSGEEASSEG